MRVAALLFCFACGGPAAGGDAGVDAAPGDVATVDVSVDVAADAPIGPTELIHLLGRFDTASSSGPRFAFPGSAMLATFTGTGLTVTLTDQNDNYFSASIDGAAPATIHTTGAQTSYSLATNLAAGQHTIALARRTESFQGIVQFGGFTVTGGALVPTPFPFTRRIEMIGDSITCGYGDLGVGPTCGFTAATEDENVAWGAIAATQLNAMHTAIAYSGKGMYRNYDGTTTNLVPEVWTRTFADDGTSTWDFTKYTPDVVVINLGTNDFAKGDPGTAFTTAYVAFMKKLRTTYPAAHIVGVVGPMLGGAAFTQAGTYLQAAIAQTADANTSYLELATQDGSDGYGCDYHPSQVRQTKMGTALAAHLHAKLGW